MDRVLALSVQAIRCRRSGVGKKRKRFSDFKGELGMTRNKYMARVETQDGFLIAWVSLRENSDTNANSALR